MTSPVPTRPSCSNRAFRRNPAPLVPFKHLDIPKHLRFAFTQPHAATLHVRRPSLGVSFRPLPLGCLDASGLAFADASVLMILRKNPRSGNRRGRISGRLVDFLLALR